VGGVGDELALRVVGVLQRLEDAPGHEPSQAERQQRHPRERDPGLVQQLLQCLCAPAVVRSNELRVLGVPEPAQGRCLPERRRLFDCGRHRKDGSVAVAELADIGVVGHGRDRDGGIGEPGDPVLSHTPRNPAPVRHRLGRGVCPRAAAGEAGGLPRAGQAEGLPGAWLSARAVLEGKYESGVDQ
jgi:hypothetical protein